MIKPEIDQQLLLVQVREERLDALKRIKVSPVKDKTTQPNWTKGLLVADESAALPDICCCYYCADVQFQTLQARPSLQQVRHLSDIKPPTWIDNKQLLQRCRVCHERVTQRLKRD